VRDGDMERRPVIILPRSQAAHLAPGCHHWVVLGTTSAMVDGVELCSMCAASIAIERQAILGRGDGQCHG
jgi:hypothetical protein